MRVFVDESGDTGINNDPSSSPHFVVTAVIFACPEEAEKCSQALDELRKELRWQPNAEFKFSKLNLKLRVRFLKTVSAFKFTYCTVILEKQKLDGKGFKFHKSFYKFSIRMLFRNAKRYLADATVCIDECGNQNFKEELEKYLDRRINAASP